MFMSLLFLSAEPTHADERPGTHRHGASGHHSAGQHGHPARPEPARGVEHTQHGQHHRHDTWETPPLPYTRMQRRRWHDPAAIDRDKQLFQTYCIVCHGADGMGTGPLLDGLAAGDRIRFTIDTQNRAIVKIDRLHQ